jgi:hypothetical protein
MAGFFLRLLATLAFAVVATASLASCPPASVDGCLGAPTLITTTDTTYQVYQPYFFTGAAATTPGTGGYAQQNGQTYASTPPWNVAGVDYPVGINASYVGNLKDPATAPLPAGCGFVGGANPYVGCSNVNNLTISGYDFGHSVAGSVQLEIAGGITGTLTISNNKFFNGPSVDSQFYDVIIYNSNSANVVFNYNYLDGNGLALPSGKMNSMVLDQSTGSLTFQYNAMVNVPSRVIGYATDSNVNISYNYGDGLGYGSPFVHPEFNFGGPAEQNGTMSSVEIGYNTFLTDSNNGGATSNIYVSNGVPGGTVLGANVDHNVVVSNTNPSPINNDVQQESAITSSWLIEAGGQTIDSLGLTDNYFDPSGSFGCVAAFDYPSAVFTGNVDMLDGSTVTSAGVCTLVSGSPVGGGPVGGGLGAGGGSDSGGGTDIGGAGAPVPETPTWAMILVAWGALGYLLARRRRMAWPGVRQMERRLARCVRDWGAAV